MSAYLFVGGPLHGQVHNYFSNNSIEPDGSAFLVVSIGEEEYTYERTSYFPHWVGPEYVVAVLPGSSGLIQETIDRTRYLILPT